MMFFEDFVLWNILLTKITFIYYIRIPFEIFNNYELVTNNENLWSAWPQMTLCIFKKTRKQLPASFQLFFLFKIVTPHVNSEAVLVQIPLQKYHSQECWTKSKVEGGWARDGWGLCSSPSSKHLSWTPVH